jgi:hypothetical protein
MQNAHNAESGFQERRKSFRLLIFILSIVFADLRSRLEMPDWQARVHHRDHGSKVSVLGYSTERRLENQPNDCEY